MNILITGVAGFVGSHLAEYILSERPNMVVHGTRRPKGSIDNIQHIADRITLHDVDSTDTSSVYRLIDTIRPQVIFHLAAQSYVHTSWESPQDTLATNIIGEANFLESIRHLRGEGYNPTFLVMGSSEEYGATGKGKMSIAEDAPLCPMSPYAVSKIGQDFLGYQYYLTYRLNIIRLRVFNHTGPRRPTAFGDSKLAHTIARIERGLAKPEVTYRDLTAIRDYTDVRDIVRAYVLAAEKCVPGEVYNVCSGNGVSIKQIYDTLLRHASVPNIACTCDPGGKRPTDGGVIIGDNRRFVAQTGWQPNISFLEQTLPDLLNYWRTFFAT